VSIKSHDQHSPPESGRGYRNGAGSPINGTSRPSIKLATASQVKLICAIARAQDSDLVGLLKNAYGVEHPEELSMPQASAFIDQLRAVGSA
jgi:hypothetical protein